MTFSIYLLLGALLLTPAVGEKQPDFFSVSEDGPPPPPTMNADFFEDPQAPAPLAAAPADAQDNLVHLDALPPAPAPMVDAPVTEALPPAPASAASTDFDGQDSVPQMPTWDDYASQQSTNAQLAERVAELTKATHLLWHEERTLRRRSHQKILSMKKKCHLARKPVHVHVNLDADEEQSRPQQFLPMSLTHAATKHHRNHRVNSNNEGLAVAEDSADGPLVGTAFGSMAGMYNPEGAENPNTGQQLEAEDQKKKRELEDELAASRARLGRNEEARLHLEDQIRDLEEKFQQGMRDAAQRKQDLAAAQKRQHAKELELTRAKKQGISQDSGYGAALRNEFGAAMKMASDRIEQEKQDLLTFRDKADTKLRARKNEARNLQAKNDELRKQWQEIAQVDNKVQEQLKAAQDTWSRLSGQVEALHRNEVEVAQEQQNEQQRLTDENDKLHSEAEEERQCMDWGHRLEARLQNELKRKVADAKLCRDSILSLHNERLELKSRAGKYKRELEEEKLREGEARRSYDENQQLLDHCLGQMSR